MSSDIIKHTAQQDCEHACSQSFNTLIADVRQIIENGRNQAYNAVEQVGITTFWNVGRRIVVELQHAARLYALHLTPKTVKVSKKKHQNLVISIFVRTFANNFE